MHKYNAENKPLHTCCISTPLLHSSHAKTLHEAKELDTGRPVTQVPTIWPLGVAKHWIFILPSFVKPLSHSTDGWLSVAEWHWAGSVRTGLAKGPYPFVKWWGTHLASERSGVRVGLLVQSATVTVAPEMGLPEGSNVCTCGEVCSPEGSIVGTCTLWSYLESHSWLPKRMGGRNLHKFWVTWLRSSFQLESSQDLCLHGSCYMEW